jgi:Kdo2-lipid IVA lauroyltransferase/acyltransferase
MTGTVGQYLAWLPQAAMLGLARALPYRGRLWLGSAFLRAAVAVVPDLRRRIDGNLRLIFPQMPEAERRRIRRGVADSFGRTFIEVFSRRAFQQKAAWRAPQGPGWAAVLEAQREGRGAIIISGHFGQWEATRAALKTQGIEAAALYRPVKNPYLQADYLAQTSEGGPMMSRNGAGMREFIRHLRGGGVVAVLADQFVQGGTAIEFLGHPAPTGLTIAEMALKYRVPPIPAYGTREPDGLHVALDFEAPIPPGTALAMTQAAADSLAARVRATPEQYYWLHRRWVKRFD